MDAPTARPVAAGLLELPSAGKADRSLPMTDRERPANSVDRETWRFNRDRLFFNK